MKKVLKIIGKILLLILCLLIIFMLGIFIFHRVMLGKEKDLISQPIGTMVEVDGGNMCVYTEGSGDHTIVFMSGYGTPSPILDFKPLYSKLNNDYRIAVVEKFGYGFSDETDMSRDIDTMLEQTRKALSKAGVEAPYILCPHSASGFEALYWAQKYPEEIEGMVALDIAMPGYHEEIGYSIFSDRAMRFICNSGLIRLVPTEPLDWGINSDALTEDEKAQYKAILYARRGSKTMIHEAEWCKRDTEKILSNAVPEIPMLFFISTRSAEIIFPSDPERYMTLARRYTDNKAEYIDLDCGHYVHVEEPDKIAAEMRRFIGELDSNDAVTE